VSGRSRLRWVAASCVAAIATVVLLGGARAWASVHHGPRCVPSAPSRSAPSAGDESSWRSEALRAAGCDAWHEMKRHRHH
jgi:hypothetical protein